MKSQNDYGEVNLHDHHVSHHNDCLNNDGEAIRVHFNFTNPPYGNSGKSDKDDKLCINNSCKEIKYIAENGSINNKKPRHKLAWF